jgi:hypothetical protein
MSTHYALAARVGIYRSIDWRWTHPSVASMSAAIGPHPTSPITPTAITRQGAMFPADHPGSADDAQVQDRPAPPLSSSQSGESEGKVHRDTTIPTAGWQSSVPNKKRGGRVARIHGQCQRAPCKRLSATRPPMIGALRRKWFRPRAGAEGRGKRPGPQAFWGGAEVLDTLSVIRRPCKRGK